jgi:hypothetical protein
MQRIRTSEEQAQLTDGLDIVTFNNYGDYMRVDRKSSAIDPGDPSVITVQGDAIGDLGEWLARFEQPSETDERDHGANFRANNENMLRQAAITVPEGVTEVDQYLDGIDTASRLLGVGSETPRTALDERVFHAGLLESTGRSALFASHKAGELLLYPDARYRIPAHTAKQLGEWVLEGKQTLIKKSIWG